MSAEVVAYDYPAAAVSCCFNGRRIRGIARIARRDGEWLDLTNGVRVRVSEIVLRGTHPFQPDAIGFGCIVCGYNVHAELHVHRGEAHP